MQELLIYLPLITPLFAAVLSLFLWKFTQAQKGVFVAAAILKLIFSVLLLLEVRDHGILSTQLAGWDAPFGIPFVADVLSVMMVTVNSIIGFAVALYSLQSIDQERVNFGFYPLIHFMLFGITGAFLTGDIFNLYVWFEVILISSFVLLTLGSRKAQLEGALKYVALNFLASMIFLAGIGTLYGLTGSLNMADLALIVPEMENTGLLSLSAVFFLIAFGIKAAIFPLFFWLPAAYHTPPLSIAALMAGMLTKVGVYALIRFFTLIFNHDIDFTHTILLWSGGFTMVVGVLGAAAQNDFRKILSFHIVSQIGYMIMGLAFYTPLAIAGAIFFIVHNIIVKTNLFLISGIVNHAKGSYKLKQLGAVYDNYPYLAAFFVITAFALTGLPPLSGFWPKFMLAKAGFTEGFYFITLVALGVSILTMFSMTKIWNEVFLKPLPDEVKNSINPLSRGALWRNKIMLFLTVIFMVVLILGMGLMAEPIIDFSQTGAEQLLDPTEYIETVLPEEYLKEQEQ